MKPHNIVPPKLVSSLLFSLSSYVRVFIQTVALVSHQNSWNKGTMTIMSCPNMGFFEQFMESPNILQI